MGVVTDPVADMLTRIRNAHQALHKDVRIPNSKMKVALAEILQSEGYIEQYNANEKEISVSLKYMSGKPVIAGLRRVSKPGRRVYVGASDIPRVQNGLGICVLSTSRGIMAGGTAEEQNIGGELLCEIW